MITLRPFLLVTKEKGHIVNSSAAPGGETMLLESVTALKLKVPMTVKYCGEKQSDSSIINRNIFHLCLFCYTQFSTLLWTEEL